MEKKVVAMPNSYFYHPKSPFISDKFVRFGICKKLETTKAALQNLIKKI